MGRKRAICAHARMRYYIGEPLKGQLMIIMMMIMIMCDAVTIFRTSAVIIAHSFGQFKGKDWTNHSKKKKIIFGIRNLFPCIPLLWRSMCNVHPKIDEKLQKVQSLHTSIASTRSYSFRKHDQYTSQIQIWLVRINHSQLMTDTSVRFGISVESNSVYTWYISQFDLLIAMQSLA